MANTAVDFTLLPAPIAIPLEKSRQGDPQRKDLLRFAFENALGLLGCVLVGDLLDQLEADEAGGGLLAHFSGDEAETLLQPFRLIGMEQMSLGKWANLTRTLGASLSELKAYTPAEPKALSAYSAAKDQIDALVTIRNQDAHGQPIPADQLDAELDRREGLLMEVLSAMQFLQSWRLVRLDRFEIKQGRQVYYGTEYTGEGSSSIEEEIDVEEVPLGEPILIGRKDPSKQIRLMPLAIVATIDGQHDLHFAVFSKELKGDPDFLHYLSARGTSDIRVTDWTSSHGASLETRRHRFQSIFKEPEIRTPRVEAALTVADSRLRVGDDGTVLTLSVANHAESPRLEGLEATIDLPPMLSAGDIAEDGRRVRLTRDQLQAGEIWEEAVPLSAVQQGSASIPPVAIDFSYVRRDEDDTADGEASELLAGPTMLVTDPNAADPMCPIINVRRTIHSDDGEIRIGDRFEYRIQLENIGLGAARDVETHVIIPDGLCTIDGPDTVRIHLLPGESRTFRWSLRAEQPGIYQARICDVVYLDLADRKYATECSEEFRFLVRSDKRRELRFKVRDIVSDLQITTEEQAEIDSLRDAFTDPTMDQDARACFVHEAASDAVVEVARAAVTDAAASRGVSIQEGVFTETKWQAKEHADRGQRTVISFAAAGIPFFAIDITDAQSGQLSFHSFDIPGGSAPPFDMSEAGVYAAKSKTNGPLSVGMQWSTLAGMDKPGISFLKGWVGRCLTRLEREIVPWRTMAESFAQALGGKAVYRWQRFEIVVPDEIKNDLCIQDIADPSGSYKCCGWCYRSSSSDGYDLIVNAKAGAPGMSRSGVNWIQSEAESGSIPDVRFYKSFAKKIGGPEQSDKAKFWLGRTIDKAAEMQAISKAAETLVDLTRRAFMRDVHKSAGATFHKKTIAPLELDADNRNWITPHLEHLHAAGVGVRLSLSSAQWIRDSIEFFRLTDQPGSGGPHTAIGRILPGRGAGELWLKWFAGMDESLAISSYLRPCDDAWPEADKVPDAVRLGLWLRVASEKVDQAAFNAWIEAVISAAACDGPGTWPTFARPALDGLTLRCNSRLADIVGVLQAEGAMDKDSLRTALGGDRAALNAINRLLYWSERYNQTAPVQGGPNGTVELEPSLALDLSAAESACVGADA